MYLPTRQEQRSVWLSVWGPACRVWWVYSVSPQLCPVEDQLDRFASFRASPLDLITHSHSQRRFGVRDSRFVMGVIKVLALRFWMSCDHWDVWSARRWSILLVAVIEWALYWWSKSFNRKSNSNNSKIQQLKIGQLQNRKLTNRPSAAVSSHSGWMVSLLYSAF